MGNIETTTKFSRLKSNSSIEDNYSFTIVIFKWLFTTAKENDHPSLWRKCSLKLDLKKSAFLKGFLNLFVFGILFTIIKKNCYLLW